MRPTADDKRICAEMKEIRELIAEFGLTLSGYDPGITAFIKGKNIRGDGFAGEPISLNDTEWNWLKPLLQELLAFRKSGFCTRCGGKGRITSALDPIDNKATKMLCPVCNKG